MGEACFHRGFDRPLVMAQRLNGVAGNARGLGVHQSQLVCKCGGVLRGENVQDSTVVAGCPADTKHQIGQGRIEMEIRDMDVGGSGPFPYPCLCERFRGEFDLPAMKL
ncbi:hypothetical protein D3C71_1195260 [compost metagenome]